MDEQIINNLIKSESKHAVTKSLMSIYTALYDRYIALLEATSERIKKRGYDDPEVRIMEERADELNKAIKLIDHRMEMED